MRILTRQSWLYALVAAALFAQTAGPGVVTSLTGKSVDLAALLCAPTGAVSEEARTAARNMLAALGIEEAEPAPPGGKHCPLCVSTYAVLLPAVSSVFEPRYRPAGPLTALKESGLVSRRPFALPVQRGPPTVL